MCSSDLSQTISASSIPLPTGLVSQLISPSFNSSAIPKNYVSFSIMFDPSINWEAVLTSAVLPAQLLAYMPECVAAALNVSGTRFESNNARELIIFRNS